ncbi:hypothetical protein AcW2_000472 [Taiwanofungus camphoratus]|nr:hypothetical protein AcW2_000472 [Antrodia cinnamomea]
MRTVLFSAVGFAVLAVLSSPAAARPSDSALNARNANPVAARAPAPSAARRHEARAPVPSNYKRSMHEQQAITPVGDISQQLCPLSMAACPISSISGTLASSPVSLSEWIEQGFECVDFSEDLTSCGGCGSVDAQYDCTAVPNALHVSCNVGSCRVDSCKPGYSLAPDGKTCVSMQ